MWKVSFETYRDRPQSLPLSGRPSSACRDYKSPWDWASTTSRQEAAESRCRQRQVWSMQWPPGNTRQWRGSRREQLCRTRDSSRFWGFRGLISVQIQERKVLTACVRSFEGTNSRRSTAGACKSKLGTELTSASCPADKSATLAALSWRSRSQRLRWASLWLWKKYGDVLDQNKKVWI